MILHEAVDSWAWYEQRPHVLVQDLLPSREVHHRASTTHPTKGEALIFTRHIVWDGDGAHPTSGQARRVLEALSVVPTVKGGAQIELHGGVDLEIEIEDDIIVMASSVTIITT